jgi:hypothetical protein
MRKSVSSAVIAAQAAVTRHRNVVALGILVLLCTGTAFAQVSRTAQLSPTRATVSAASAARDSAPPVKVTRTVVRTRAPRAEIRLSAPPKNVTAGAISVVRAMVPVGARCRIVLRAPDGRFFASVRTTIRTGRVQFSWSNAVSSGPRAWSVHVECRGSKLQRGTSRTARFRVFNAHRSGIRTARMDAPVVIGPTVDPSNPAAGISDPVAGLPILNRDCASTQIDVNAASIAQLMAALRVPKDSAQRIVTGRPWQRSVDVLSVPGVGTSSPTSDPAALGRAACATPTTLPVATPLACKTGTTAVDLQTASRRDIMAATGLGQVIVDRLIAARPLPQDLQQDAGARVVGLGGPTASSLASSGRVCVTPPPFTYAGTAWRWVANAGGAIITAPSDRRYALYVPAGATSSSAGAWGAVEPKHGDDLGTLRGSYHLYDSGWTGEVGVRLPANNLDGTGDTLITHIHPDGTESVSWGASTVDGPNYATVAVTSLSDFTSDEFECLPNGGSLTAIFDCGDSPDDLLPGVLGQQRARNYEDAVTPTIKPGPCNDLGRVHSSGSVPYGMSCGHDGGNGDTATWTLTNDTGASVLLGLFDSTGAVFQVDKVANADSLAYVRPTGLSQYNVVALTKRILAEQDGLLVAPASMSITRPAGAPAGVLHLGPAEASVAASAWVALNAVSIAQDAMDIADPVFVQSVYDVVNDCVLGGINSGLDSIPGCIHDGADALASQQWSGMDGRTKAARKLKTAIKAGRLWWASRPTPERATPRSGTRARPRPPGSAAGTVRPPGPVARTARS